MLFRSDVIAGALIAKTPELGEKLHFIQFASGGILGPHDSYLVLRGIKTLALRVQRHSENGQKIAEYLQNHPKVEQVFYPNLASNPQLELAKKQMKTFGGMISFTFKSGKKEDSIKFLEKLKVFTLRKFRWCRIFGKSSSFNDSRFHSCRKTCRIGHYR